MSFPVAPSIGAALSPIALSKPSALSKARRKAAGAGIWLGCAGLLLAGSGCKSKGAESEAVPATSASAGTLTPELAAKVLVKVGEKAITLGDFAAALERMDQFERLRYQSPERRKKLLEEMINVELLAGEAERRGLDKTPETRLQLRQMLRDEMLKEARRSVPKPDAIPEAEVRAYFEANKGDFAEPERRRVAHIALANKAAAERVLKMAQSATPDQWGRLVRSQSLDVPQAPSENTALELAGDLGIVGPVGHPRGANPRVPEPLQAAVFEIPTIGGVYPKVVEHGGRFHVVRLTGKTDARQRTFVDAERTIRVAIVQKAIRDSEARFEKELRERFPVKIDEAALSEVKLPEPPAAPPTSSAAPTAVKAPLQPPSTSNANPVPARAPQPTPAAAAAPTKANVPGPAASH